MLKRVAITIWSSGPPCAAHLTLPFYAHRRPYRDACAKLIHKTRIMEQSC